MTIEKLPSGSYRIRQRHEGKYISITLDHKPTQREALILMSERIQDAQPGAKESSFEKCALEYLESKRNIISPATLGGYKKILRQISPEFKRENIYNVTQLDILKEVNRYSKGKKPKTVSNFYGFISAVFKLYRPSFNASTTLPQKVKFEPYLPTEDDIRRILEASKDNVKYHICFQLGVMSLRRSEVCALTLEDVDFENNRISVNKAYIYDENNKPIIRHLTKSTEGKRKIYIPQSLVDEIKQNGFIIDVLPHMLVKTLHKYQEQLDIPEFRFHDLRHFFASYAHEQGMTDAAIMETGGWQTPYVMTGIYRRAMEKEKIQSQKKVADGILS